jgi:hypothetical protein
MTMNFEEDDDDSSAHLGCFITTAVCESFSKPGDYYELAALWK